MCYSSHFKGTLTENQPYFKRMEILVFDTNRPLSAIFSPCQFTQRHSGEGGLFTSEKNLWRRVLEANKKQVPPKNYSLEIRIDSVNQILKSKEKVKYTCDISMLTRITDWKILCVFIHVYCVTKNWGPGPYNSLHDADNRRYFWGLSLIKNWREVHMFYLAREVGKFDMFLLRKR